MRNYFKTIPGITAFIVLNAIAPVHAANSYQDVVENHSAGLREKEKVEIRIENPVSTVITNSFQDVIEKNNASLKSNETHEERMVTVDSLAPTGYLDVIFGNRS